MIETELHEAEKRNGMKAVPVIGGDAPETAADQAKRVCPLISSVAPTNGGVRGVQFARVAVPCETDCAWYHEQSKRCSVRIIATGILALKDSTEHIETRVKGLETSLDQICSFMPGYGQ